MRIPSTSAQKLRYAAYALLCCQVRLLLGEIPERAEFSAPGMREPLTPYFELTCAVRSGDLATFRCAGDAMHTLLLLFGANCNGSSHRSSLMR